MKKAVIYARYSSDSQTEQSIEGQLRVCNEYARTHDILVLKTYIDRAMTGTNDKRPGFRQMIEESAKKEWDYVLVYKFDRFSRNRFETAIHKKTLKDNGVKVVSATEYVPDTPEAVIFEGMLEAMAQYYSEELSQKIRRGNNESRIKGNLTGGTLPYGYKNVDKKATIIEDKAEVVRFIFRQYAKGVYVKDIIAALTEKGITYHGKRFAKNTIYGILKNERYAGIYNIGGKTFTNIYPPIIDKETFEKVRKIVDSNKYGKTSYKMTYLLKDKLKCGYCGQSVIGENGTAKSGERKYYYKCRGRKSKITDCNNPAIRKEVLEKIVIDNIMLEMGKPEVIEQVVSEVIKIQERRIQNNTVLNLLEKEKKNIETSIENIMSAIEKGVVTNTTTTRLKELEEKQTEIAKQIAIERCNAKEKLTETQIREFYKEAMRLEPQALINYLVEEITLFKDRIEIHFKTPLKESPENDRGFSFGEKRIRFSYENSFKREIIYVQFEIEMYVS